MTKEEEAVIEATRASHGGGVCKIHMAKCPQCKAVDALDASRTPKKPTSSETLADALWVRSCGTIYNHNLQAAIIKIISEAESAAWDRATERAIGAARAALDDFSLSGDQVFRAIEALKGKCHGTRP
jgi:hypothetical protein